MGSQTYVRANNEGVHQHQQASYPSQSPNSSNSSSTRRTEGNLFLTLPPEIRNVIYEYVLAWPPGECSIREGYQAADREWEPAFLRAASGQIRQEAAPIYYFKNKVQVELVFGDIREFGLDLWEKAKILRTIVELCGNKPFSSFEFSVRLSHKPAHVFLSDLIPLLELMRKTGVTLGTPKTRIRGRNVPETLLQDLEEALALGDRAYARGWNGGVLKIQFNKWSQQKKLETKQAEERKRQAREEQRNRPRDPFRLGRPFMFAFRGRLAVRDVEPIWRYA